MLADADKRARYDRFGHAAVAGAAGGARIRPDHLRRVRRHLRQPRRHLRLRRHVRRRPPAGGPQRGADLRYDLEITFEQSAKGAETDDSDSAPRDLRDLSRLRRGAGLLADDVPAVPRGRTDPLSAGLLHRRADLRAVPRQRPGDHQAVRDVPRTGHERTACASSPSRSPPASPPASACACPAKAKLARRADRPAISTWSFTSRSCVLPARRQRPAVRDSGLLHHARARRRDQRARRRRRRDREDPRGHADRLHCSGSKARACPTLRPRQAATSWSPCGPITPKKLSKEQKKLLEQLRHPARAEVRADAERRRARTGACSTR